MNDKLATGKTSDTGKTSPLNATQIGVAMPTVSFERDTDDQGTHTLPMSRRAIFGGIDVHQRALLEVSGAPPGTPQHLQLGTGEILVGRAPDCQLSLRMTNVSRRHARIYFNDDEYHLEDLNSTNGTFVNGIQVSRCVLRHNDLIEIGEAKIIFAEEKVRR